MFAGGPGPMSRPIVGPAQYGGGADWAVPVSNIVTMNRTAIVVAIVLGAAATSHAQGRSSPVRFSLLDAVVFYGTPPTDGYPADVLREARQFAQRANGYRPRPRPPKLASDMTMAYAAREGYERKLVAAGGQGTEQLAQQYVDDLRPCYEWEGFHDCPEREALFAEKHRSGNPNSPFRELLPLLIAHRWLCTAEGYEREGRPADGVRARSAFRSELATALVSPSALFRTAAQELQARGGCHTPGTIIRG